MSAENKVPAIRFKGFSGEWEAKELGELGSVAMNKRIFKEQTCSEGDVPFFKIGTFGGQADAFISRKLFDEYKSNYPFPEKGDLLISASGSIGRVVEYAGDDQYFQDSNIVWLKHGGKVNNSFLKVFYSIVKWSGLEGSTIKRLYNKNILETAISLPKPEEQIKVGHYFQQLDTLIAQHQQKHDKLLNLKKALLEKMFPKKNDELRMMNAEDATKDNSSLSTHHSSFNVPEIRFKGFSGEWEETALGEFSEVTTGKLDANAMKVDGEYDFYTSGIKKYKIDIPAFEGPAITIAGNGATVGYMHLADGKFNAYQRTYVLTNFIANRYFLYFQIGKVLPIKISQEARTGNIPYIVLDMLTDLEIVLPKKEEQTKIGNLFKQLNTLINQHQAQLKKLNNIKQACLEKMFV